MNEVRGGASSDCEDDTHARFVEPFEPKPRPRRHIRAAIGDLPFPLLVVSHLLANYRLVAPPTPRLPVRCGVSVLKMWIVHLPIKYQSRPTASPRPTEFPFQAARLTPPKRPGLSLAAVILAL